MCLVTGRFHLDGTYLVPVRNQEIHFIVVFSALCGESIIVQFMSGCFQHLCDDVFIDIAEIRAQLVTEQFMVNRIVGKLLVPKREGNEQPRVCRKHLVLVGILMQCHPAPGSLAW